MDISPTRKHRILLLGEDLSQINSLKRHLDISSMECECVTDIKTAHHVLRARSMDVLVIDSDLENASTKKTMKNLVGKFKNNFNHTRIVVYNGVSNRTIQRRIRRSGADGYLSNKNNMKNVAMSVKRVLSL